EVTRARAREAEARRVEADLAAEMARILLRGTSLADDLPTAAARMARALRLNSAAITTETVEGDERSVAFPLREGSSRLGTLLVGADTVKTALLRAVSHDLRSPLTAISAAGEAVGSPSLSPQERQEMAAVIQE